jgi:hypothetical protein
MDFSTTFPKILDFLQFFDYTLGIFVEKNSDLFLIISRKDHLCFLPDFENALLNKGANKKIIS